MWNSERELQEFLELLKNPAAVAETDAEASDVLARVDELSAELNLERRPSIDDVAGLMKVYGFFDDASPVRYDADILAIVVDFRGRRMEMPVAIFTESPRITYRDVASWFTVLAEIAKPVGNIDEPVHGQPIGNLAAIARCDFE